MNDKFLIQQILLHTAKLEIWPDTINELNQWIHINQNCLTEPPMATTAPVPETRSSSTKGMVFHTAKLIGTFASPANKKQNFRNYTFSHYV